MSTRSRNNIPRVSRAATLVTKEGLTMEGYLHGLTGLHQGQEGGGLYLGSGDGPLEVGIGIHVAC